MYDDLKAHFVENVATDYSNYVETRKSPVYGRSVHLRSAIAAATSLYHFREHLPPAHKKSRVAVAKVCPDYDILGDVVNAAKHRKLTKGRPRLTSAQDIFEQTVITQYEDSDGEYRDCQTTVVARTRDGTERDLLPILTNVVNYWGRLLETLGVLDSFSPYDTGALPGEGYVSREIAKGMDLELTSGIRFRQQMKLLKYDPRIGRAEPIDLTGSTARIKLYRPSYTVDIHLTNSKSGEKIDLSLKLDDEESLTWCSLKTDAERDEFADMLIRSHQDEIRKILKERAKEIGNDDA